MSVTPLSSFQFAQQMIAQLRILDPSASAEVGTPERKIIDTVAQSLAANQVDLTGLSGALDIDSKVGSNLDRFTSLFGFQRQQATAATGYVIFSTNTVAPAPVTIPVGTILQSTNVGINGEIIQYTTTATGSIPLNQTISGLVPIQCTISGVLGNVPSNSITTMTGQPVIGVTAVTNPTALTNGLNQEDDNSYKVRFKNTVFRNLAGTEDQFLALAVSTPFTTKANVVGPISRYQEYIQIPNYDDAGYVNGVAPTVYTFTAALTAGSDVIELLSTITPTGLTSTNAPGQVIATVTGGSLHFTNGATVIESMTLPTIGGQITVQEPAQTNDTVNMTITLATPAGLQNQWTTACSIIPYAQSTYNNLPAFVSNGATSVAPDYFYRPNADFIFNVPPVGLGDAFREGSVGAALVATQPNFTFINVYNPPTGEVTISGLQAVTPGQVVLSEFSYTSSASRNDLTHNVTNAIDVYVSGDNETQASTVFTPAFGSTLIFTNNPTSLYYNENYRRDGQPAKRPNLGNYLTPLFQSPLDSLPDTISIDGVNYYEGIHYWLVHEMGQHLGSIRARDGIEWAVNIGGDPGSNPPPDDYQGNDYTSPDYQPVAPYNPSGAQITPAIPSVEVDNYSYDANIVTLQAAMEKSRQITTDVLVHKSKTRYFKLDLTLIYSPNSNPAAVNIAIGTAIQQYFDNQYFGSIVQLSSLLDIVYSVPGVQNVRWSNDVSNVTIAAPANLIRVLETDVNGIPLHGVATDRFFPGTVSAPEVQNLFITGYDPFGADDTVTLQWLDETATLGAGLASGATTFTLTTPVPQFPTGGGTAYLSLAGSPDYIPSAFTYTAYNASTGVFTGIPATGAGSITTAWPIDSVVAFNMITAPITLNTLATDALSGSTSALQGAINAAQPATGLYHGITASALARSAVNVTRPLQSYTLTFTSNGTPVLPIVVNNITGSTYAFDSDFFLLDDELPSLPTGPALSTDTGGVAGLILRARAESTWNRPGLG